MDANVTAVHSFLNSKVLDSFFPCDLTDIFIEPGNISQSLQIVSGEFFKLKKLQFTTNLDQKIL